MVCACLVRENASSSSRVSSSRTGRRVASTRWADDVLDEHLLLRPEAAADPGLDHVDALDRQADQGATMRRTWNGTCVEVRSTSRSSSSSQPIVMCGSIGQACTCWTWKVCSNTRSAPASAPSRSRVVCPSMCALMLRAGVVDADRVLLVVDHRRPVSHRRQLVEDGRQYLVGHLDQAAGLRPRSAGCRRRPPPPGRPRAGPCHRS